MGEAQGARGSGGVQGPRGRHVTDEALGPGDEWRADKQGEKSVS